MERVFWAIASLGMVILGVLVLRHTAAVVDALYARQEPNYYDEKQPTFHVKRGLLDERDRGVQLALSRAVAVAAIIIGLGMLLTLAVTWR